MTVAPPAPPSPRRPLSSEKSPQERRELARRQRTHWQIRCALYDAFGLDPHDMANDFVPVVRQGSWLDDPPDAPSFYLDVRNMPGLEVLHGVPGAEEPDSPGWRIINGLRHHLRTEKMEIVGRENHFIFSASSIEALLEGVNAALPPEHRINPRHAAPLRPVRDTNASPPSR